MSTIKPTTPAEPAGKNRMARLAQEVMKTFQRGFPIVARPFAAIAEHLGYSEEEVLEALRILVQRGILSRVGPVFAPKRVGVSTLAAMAVPAEKLESVASWLNTLPEVNHNYEREHDLNLWFVVTARDEEHLFAVLNQIGGQTGMQVHDLRLIDEFRIDLGFDLQDRALASLNEVCNGC